MTTSTPSTARSKRGAPKGNINALKHGFYSQAFSHSEHERLEHCIQGELSDEEALLRTLISRTLESMQGREMSHEELIVSLRAVALAIARLESLQRTRKVIYHDQTGLEKVFAELAAIPVEED
jgi:uncharacterized protein YjcR